MIKTKELTKRSRRRVSLILTVCMILTSLTGFGLFSVSAAEDGDGGIMPISLSPSDEKAPSLVLGVPDKYPAVGETFKVTLAVKNNPGFGAMQISLGCDSGLKPTVVETGSLIDGMITVTNKDASDGARIVAAGVKNTEGDGTAAIITYQVVSEGTHSFKTNDLRFWDADGKEFAVSEKQETKPASDLNKETGTVSSGVGGTDVVTDNSPQTAPAKTNFPDVPAGHWAEGFIAKAVDAGLFKGYTDGRFGTNDNVTRVQFVTVLWRNSGSPAAGKTASFTDINTSADTEYAKAVNWAAENGVVTGLPNGDGTMRFAPDGTITRQDAMTILFRYDGGVSGDESAFTAIYDASFTDSAKIASYAKPAMYWAVYKSFISGVGDSMLAPEASATRAQLAKILVSYKEGSKTE